jgi:hypothetical protein
MTNADVPVTSMQLSVVAPADDTGSDTAVLYRYQDQLAAAHSLAMLHKEGARIICEWHADFLIEQGSNEWELVSVKHLDAGSWTFGKLFDDGGLALLFDTWIALGRNVSVRLCTNASFSTSKSPISARVIEELCGDKMHLALIEPDNETCSAVAWAALKVASKGKLVNLPVVKIPVNAAWTSSEGLPAGIDEAARAFLGVLRIEKFPSKQHVRDHVIRSYVEPALKSVGRDTRAADVCYDKLLEAVCAASRDNDNRPLDPLERLNAKDAFSLPNKIDERLRRRSITVEIVRRCLAVPYMADVPLLPAGRRPPRAPGGRKLDSKLTDARVHDDDRIHTQGLRDLWHDSWPRIATGFPQDLDVQYALEQEILNLVRILRLELAGQDNFGTRLIAALHARLRIDALNSKPALALHDTHLQGFAYELSDQCLFNFLDIGASS